MPQAKSKYPVPDRSNFTPNEVRDDDPLPEGDLGARAIVLSDGRPCRVESWCQGGYTFVTLFFSTLGLAKATPKRLLGLVAPVLAREHIAAAHRTLTATGVHVMDDAAGQRVFSLTFVAGEPEF